LRVGSWELVLGFLNLVRVLGLFFVLRVPSLISFVAWPHFFIS
jgi:hypothetical protein